MARPRKPLSERFWTNIIKTDSCWLWQGALFRGYGYIVDTETSRQLRAHRASWELINGPIPEGLFVCHKCDVRNCVNPDHLFLGTHKDNMKDMTNKERQAKGDKIWSRTRPEKLKRGDEHYTHTNPELLHRGDDHWTRKHPELRTRGTRVNTNKLSENDVREIRRLHSINISRREITKRFNVGYSTINCIIRGDSWKWLDKDGS